MGIEYTLKQFWIFIWSLKLVINIDHISYDSDYSETSEFG